MAAPEEPDDYPAQARKRDDEIEDAMARVTRSWVPVRLGTLSTGQDVSAHSTYSWDASYPTGGETVPTLGVPSVGTIHMLGQGSAAGQFYFRYSSGKVLAYVATTGAEVADTTDLSSITGVPYSVIGSEPDARECYRAVGRQKVIQAAFSVGTDWTLDASNYWTLTLRHRKAGQTTGELVGADYAVDTRGLTAQELVTLYDGVGGLAMADGERLALYVVETGTAVALEDLILWLLIQRIAR